jgi:hypothetical protein
VLEISWTQHRRRTVTVTNAGKVRQVARAVNGMPLNGLGVCAEGFVPSGIKFFFRSSRRSKVLATVDGVLRPDPGAFCEPTLLRVRGHRAAWLVEDSSLLNQASRILGRSLF